MHLILQVLIQSPFSIALVNFWHWSTCCHFAKVKHTDTNLATFRICCHLENSLQSFCSWFGEFFKLGLLPYLYCSAKELIVTELWKVLGHKLCSLSADGHPASRKVFQSSLSLALVCTKLSHLSTLYLVLLILSFHQLW